MPSSVPVGGMRMSVTTMSGDSASMRASSPARSPAVPTSSMPSAARAGGRCPRAAACCPRPAPPGSPRQVEPSGGGASTTAGTPGRALTAPTRSRRTITSMAWMPSAAAASGRAPDIRAAGGRSWRSASSPGITGGLALALPRRRSIRTRHPPSIGSQDRTIASDAMVFSGQVGVVAPGLVDARRRGPRSTTLAPWAPRVRRHRRTTPEGLLFTPVGDLVPGRRPPIVV